MSERLFEMANQDIDDYFLDIKYDGPSFQGFMEIHHLGEEILGLEYCLKKIIKSLRRSGKLDLLDGEFEIFVQAFEPGSFKKRVKILVRDIEKYKTTVTVLVALFVGILHAIPMYGAKRIKEMSPELMSEIADQTKIQLLQDKDYLINLLKTIQPIQADDKVFFRPPGNLSETMCINHNAKREFLELVDEENLPETTDSGIMRGRIIKIDLDATKHQFDFKEDGKGARIDCSLSSVLNIYDYRDLLGKWVEISGEITRIEDKISSIHILEIQEISPPLKEATQESIEL